MEDKLSVKGSEQEKSRQISGHGDIEPVDVL